MIHFCICYIIDISGIITNFKYWLSDIKKKEIYSIKPFDCSTCINFWFISFYCIIFTEFCIINSVFIGCIFAFFAPLTTIILDKISQLYERL